VVGVFLVLYIYYKEPFGSQLLKGPFNSSFFSRPKILALVIIYLFQYFTSYWVTFGPKIFFKNHIVCTQCHQTTLFILDGKVRCLYVNFHYYQSCILDICVLIA
jgi:hypothetical protein